MDRTNDFAFKIATPNGTGSASANGLLMQAIFRMGVPVTGKNVFPSNIQGLPTWYEIRVSRNGYTARTPTFDLMVALNPATYQKDVAEVRSGGWLLYDSTWPLDARLTRPDVTYLGIPLSELCNARFAGARERILMKNIAYVGALAGLLEHRRRRASRDAQREVREEGRRSLDSNQAALDLGRDYATTHFACPLPIRLAPMDATKDAILIDGNTAAALGCLYAGATVGAWYPDHAGDLADGSVQGVLPEVSPRARDQPQSLRHPPGGGRDRGDRDGRSARRGPAPAPSRRRPGRASR